MVVFVQGSGDASNLMNVVQINGPWEASVTLLARLGRYCSTGLGKFNIDAKRVGCLRKHGRDLGDGALRYAPTASVK